RLNELTDQIRSLVESHNATNDHMEARLDAIDERNRALDERIRGLESHLRAFPTGMTTPSRALTEIILRQALIEKTKPAAIINKVDRVPLELQLPKEEPYDKSDDNIKLTASDAVVRLDQSEPPDTALSPGPANELATFDVVVCVDQFSRLLSSPDIEVRQKCIYIATNLVSHHNIHDVVSLLKKELIKAYNSHYDKVSSYRPLPIQPIQLCTVHFSVIAVDIVQVFLRSIDELNTSSMAGAIKIACEIAEKPPD
ncbi:coatomer subunit beta, partial [Spiromyces aspiralis]